jgi:hypothetical protein
MLTSCDVIPVALTYSQWYLMSMPAATVNVT